MTKSAEAQWWDGPIKTFDLETTGTDPEEARVVTANVSTVNVRAIPVSEDEVRSLFEPRLQLLGLEKAGDRAWKRTEQVEVEPAAILAGSRAHLRALGYRLNDRGDWLTPGGDKLWKEDLQRLTQNQLEALGLQRVGEDQWVAHRREQIEDSAVRYDLASYLRSLGMDFVREQGWLRSEVELIERLQWVVDPGIEIPEDAAKVHGYTTERVRAEGVTPEEAIPEIMEAVVRNSHLPLVIYNAGYDLTVLDREIERLGLGELPVAESVIDPYVIDKHIDKWRSGSRKLEPTCHVYGIRIGEEGAHDAGADAMASAQLAWWLVTRAFPDRLKLPLPELHRQQVEMRRIWAEDYEKYLLKQGKTEEAKNIRADWPIKPRPELVLPLAEGLAV